MAPRSAYRRLEHEWHAFQRSGYVERIHLPHPPAPTATAFRLRYGGLSDSMPVCDGMVAASDMPPSGLTQMSGLSQMMCWSGPAVSWHRAHAPQLRFALGIRLDVRGEPLPLRRDLSPTRSQIHCRTDVASPHTMSSACRACALLIHSTARLRNTSFRQSPQALHAGRLPHAQALHMLCLCCHALIRMDCMRARLAGIACCSWHHGVFKGPARTLAHSSKRMSAGAGPDAGTADSAPRDAGYILRMTASNGGACRARLALWAGNYAPT